MDFGISSIFPVIWNYGPDIFTIGGFHVRWYNCIFALIFIIARSLGIMFFQKANKEVEKVDTIIVYCMLGAVLGSRLAHVIFYDWAYFSHHLLEIFLPFKFSPSFEFVGYKGLASHGIIPGLVIAMYFCLKKINSYGKKTTLLWLFDKIAIGGAVAGCILRIGNFMNSEIYGEPTANALVSVVFVRETVDLIKNSAPFVEKISVGRVVDERNAGEEFLQPIVLRIIFKKQINDEGYVRSFLENNVKAILANSYVARQNIFERKDLPLRYSLTNDKGTYSALVVTDGVKRHPSQLYESFTYAIILALLFFVWYRKHNRLRDGVLIGLFLIIVFSLRLIHETLKDRGDVVFSTSWGNVNTAQALSIPIIILGLVFYFWNYKKGGAEN